MTKTLTTNCVLVFMAALAGCAGTINNKVFSSMDTNNDASVSYEEFSADEPDKDYAKREFKKADANGDDKITKDEMRAYIESTM